MEKTIEFNNKNYVLLGNLDNTYIKETTWLMVSKAWKYYSLGPANKKDLINAILDDNDYDVIRTCKYDNKLYQISEFKQSDKIYNTTIKNRNKIRREESRNKIQNNLPILRKLFSGDENNPLVYLGEELENINPYGEGYDSYSIFDLHHVCFKDSKSEGKTNKEPSKYVNSFDLTDLSTSKEIKIEGVNQLLLCQILPKNPHSIIHLNYKSDNITRFLDEPKKYDTNYHFLSKNNYDDCISYLAKYGYQKSDLLSYEEMLKITLSNEVEKK